MRRFPTTLTLLPTYRCTAACENCCFDSNPGARDRAATARLLEYIDQAARVPTIRVVVISGGEPFLLGKDLEVVVARAHAHGLATRIVTNGYWATTPAAASMRLTTLAGAGLKELNVSTGDFHVEFVPIDRVAFAARAAVDLEMQVVIMVERRAGRSLIVEDIRSHPLLRDIAGDPDRARGLIFVESPWMARGPAVQGGRRAVEEGAFVAQEPQALLTRQNLHTRSGCSSILNGIVITPYEQFGACCGLPREEIPELNDGGLRIKGVERCYEEARGDFVKVWLAVEGPEHILAWAAQYDSTIEWEGLYAHQCEACRAVYRSPKVASVIRAHYREKLPDVLLKFAAFDVSGSKNDEKTPRTTDALTAVP
jgi:hypothetical protein